MHCGALARQSEIWYESVAFGKIVEDCGGSVMHHEPIGVASDHAGFELKQIIKSDLERLGRAVIDLGVGDVAPVDYPDFGYAMAHALRNGRVTRGVLICGSGVGISIAANRYAEVRAALVHDALGARLARQHNDANVICFGGRMIGAEVARDCLRVFLETAFEGGRHCRRVEKLSNPS
jgi:ribose 5-phosphate isomerase B